MTIYLTIITTALVVSQIIRVVQNTIQLHRQDILFKKALNGVDDITQEDLNNQRKAYRLMIEYYESIIPKEPNDEDVI